MKRNEKRRLVGKGILAASIVAAASLTTLAASAQGIQESKTDDGYAIAVLTIDPLPERTPEAGQGMDI